MSILKGKTEGGSGGKRGHSNMDHWVTTEEFRFRGIWARGCMGRSWRTAFPSVSKAEIRDFLDFFVDAFGFSRKQKLSFEPSDRVMDIYRTRYTSRFSADGLELETLARNAKRRYGIDLVPLWHEGITLGELFERVRQRVA